VDKFVRPERINLRLHPELSEKWVQKLIADDPSKLGLGDLEVRAMERVQPLAGGLTFCCRIPRSVVTRSDPTGRDNESRIIRTLEYWDIERSVTRNMSTVRSSSPRTSSPARHLEMALSSSGRALSTRILVHPAR